MTHTERFDTLFSRITAAGETIDLTRAHDLGRFGMRLHVHAGKGVHINETMQPTSRGIALVLQTIERMPKLGDTSLTFDRVELYRNQAGEVLSNFNWKTDVFVNIAPGVNYGHLAKDYEIPVASQGIALESALTAVENALTTQAEYLRGRRNL